MGASDPRERPHARLDWRAGRASPRGPRGVFIQGSSSELALGWGSLVGNAPRRPPRRPNGRDGGDRSAFRVVAAVSPDGAPPRSALRDGGQGPGGEGRYL